MLSITPLELGELIETGWKLGFMRRVEMRTVFSPAIPTGHSVDRNLVAVVHRFPRLIIGEQPCPVGFLLNCHSSISTSTVVAADCENLNPVPGTDNALVILVTGHADCAGANVGQRTWVPSP